MLVSPPSQALLLVYLVEALLLVYLVVAQLVISPGIWRRQEAKLCVLYKQDPPTG